MKAVQRLTSANNRLDSEKEAALAALREEVDVVCRDHAALEADKAVQAQRHKEEVGLPHGRVVPA